MRRQLTVLGMLCLLSACASVRTVYDEQGRVVKESESKGGERDFADYMEEKSNASFSEKKNEQGIPQAVSDKVSSFQSKLDESRRIDKTYLTGEYAGTSENSLRDKRFSGADKSYDTSGRFYDEGRHLDRELNPAFAREGHGIYGGDDEYAGAQERSELAGKKSSMGGEYYTKENPYYSRSDESGYFETRRDDTPPPPVYSRDEYVGKTIDEVRSLLGRDKKAE